MKVSQISTILNTVFGEITGGAVVKEDLSNIVDIGRTIISTTQWGDNFDKYVAAIIDKVGRVVVWDRVYRGDDLGLLREGWEYGSIMEKIRVEVGDYVDNPVWQLTDSPAPDFSGLFDFDSAPTVTAKYFNFKTTFNLEICIAREQAESAFRSAADMQKFFGGIENRIRTKMEIGKEGLAYRAEVNFIAEKIADYNLNGGCGFVNLLEAYHNDGGDATLTTAADAWYNIEFLRYCVRKIRIDRAMLRKATRLYNVEHYTAFTPEDRLGVFALADFAAAIESILMSQTYHDEFVSLPGYREVAFWQGTGTAAGLTDRASINAIPASDPGGTAITADGIVFVMQDRDAVMIACEQNPVDSLYNPKGRFYKYFYHADCSYYNDLAENGIVYAIQDHTPIP